MSTIKTISLKKIQSMINKSESINCSFYSFITYYRKLSQANQELFDKLMFPMYCSVIPNDCVKFQVINKNNEIQIGNDTLSFLKDNQLNNIIEQFTTLFSKVHIDNLECMYNLNTETVYILDYQSSIETTYRYNVLTHINTAINYYIKNSLLQVQLPTICNNINDLIKVMSAINENYNTVKWMRSNEFNNNKNNIFTKSKKSITV